MSDEGAEPSVESFFSGHPESRALFDTVAAAVYDLGDAEVRVMKSQIAFRRKRDFAWVWRPGQYLRGDVAPLVLTFSFPWRDPSGRWKEVVKTAPRRFTHHLEITDSSQIDGAVRGWIHRAWEQAG